MKLFILTASLASVLFLSGCSSNKAEEVAYSMCELAKNADVKGMKKYAEPEFAEALDELEKVFKVALANDIAKKEFDKTLAILKDVDCKKSTIITDISDTKKQVSNGETKQVFFLNLNEDGEWKVNGL